MLVHTKTPRSQHSVPSRPTRTGNRRYMCYVCLLECLRVNITHKPVWDRHTAMLVQTTGLCAHIHGTAWIPSVTTLTYSPARLYADSFERWPIYFPSGAELGAGVRVDRVMSDRLIPHSVCVYARVEENKAQSSSCADAGSTHTLKENTTNNISQGSDCTNIPRAFSPKLC